MRINIMFKNKHQLRSSVSSFFFLTIYAMLLAFLFVNWVYPTYAYVGYTFGVNINNICLSFLYLAIISLFITVNPNTIKIFFIYIFILRVLIPMMCLYCFTEEFSGFDLYIFMSIICFVIIDITSCWDIEIKQNMSSVTYSGIFIPLMTLITLFVMSRYLIINGIGMFSLDITKVYDYRILLRESMSGYLAYLDTWTIKIINPFCIVYSLYRNKKNQLVFFIVLQILLFGLSSVKSVLFTPFVLVLLYYVTPFILKKRNNVLLVSIYSCMIPLCMYFFNISSIWSGFFHRIFFTPVRLNFQYYDYFSVNRFDWFAHSFLRHFLSSQYDNVLPRIIGFEFYGLEEMNANTGILGSGYAQGGFLVLVLYSIILGIFISIIASLSKKVPNQLIVSLSMFPMSAPLIGADLPASILTYGLLITLLILYIIYCDPKISIKNSEIPLNLWHEHGRVLGEITKK